MIATHFDALIDAVGRTAGDVDRVTAWGTHLAGVLAAAAGYWRGQRWKCRGGTASDRRTRGKIPRRTRPAVGDLAARRHLRADRDRQRLRRGGDVRPRRARRTAGPGTCWSRVHQRHQPQRAVGRQGRERHRHGDVGAGRSAAQPAGRTRVTTPSASTPRRQRPCRRCTCCWSMRSAWRSTRCCSDGATMSRGPLVIVGDAMLDIDIEGSATRLSPEAPVPVVDTERVWHRPGGAGLAALLAARHEDDVVLVTASDTRRSPSAGLLATAGSRRRDAHARCHSSKTRCGPAGSRCCASTTATRSTTPSPACRRRRRSGRGAGDLRRRLRRGVTRCPRCAPL